MVAPVSPKATPEDPGHPPLPDPFEIVSIRAVSAPKGATGTSWHRYEISQGHNRIVGYRVGPIGTVTVAVEGIVRRLNERRQHARGRVHVVLQSKSTLKKLNTQ